MASAAATVVLCRGALAALAAILEEIVTLVKPVLIALAVLAGPAGAQTAPKLSQIIADLESRGYVTSEIEVKRDRIEVEARTAAGARVELDIDPATGAIRSERPDD